MKEASHIYVYVVREHVAVVRVILVAIEIRNGGTICGIDSYTLHSLFLINPINKNMQLTNNH